MKKKIGAALALTAAALGAGMPAASAAPLPAAGDLAGGTLSALDLPVGDPTDVVTGPGGNFLPGGGIGNLPNVGALNGAVNPL